jgi:hypothetical protein
MKLATDLLLTAYQTRLDEHSVPITVEKLCDISGATLTGARPKARNSNAYATHSQPSRRGHTGKLCFYETKVSIKIPDDVDYLAARISVAHELGHLLIHRRGSGYDEATIRLGSSPEEEALAEYAARLLLIPSTLYSPAQKANLAEFAISQASRMRVTLHSVVLRLGDPDVSSAGVRGAILWRIYPSVPSSEPLHARLTPQWHLCPDAFIPIRKCTARQGSLVAQVAAAQASVAKSELEDVNIGSFVGQFRNDAFAWGSVEDGTRLVLTIFREPRELLPDPENK